MIGIETAQRPEHRRIAIYIPSLHGGGAERAMLMFAREALLRGFEVDLVTVKLEGPLRELIPDGVRVVDLKSRRATLSLPRLVSYLRREQPGALYSTIMNANVVAGVAAKIGGKRTKIILRESNAPLSSPKKNWSRWITFKLAPYCYSRANGVIAVSHGVADELNQMMPKLGSRIRVISTPVISEDVIRQGDESVNHPWFIERDKPIVVSAARLEPHKGFLNLVRAFAEVRQRLDARLVILGEGTLEGAIRASIDQYGLNEHVAMMGFVKNPFAFMSKADAFVLASEYEGLPNVLVQAMAFGTPIVATDCKSGPAEILERGRFGILVPVNDHQALAKGLEQALSQPCQYEAMAHARANYGAKRAADEYLSLAGL